MCVVIADDEKFIVFFIDAAWWVNGRSKLKGKIDLIRAKQKQNSVSLTNNTLNSVAITMTMLLFLVTVSARHIFGCACQSKFLHTY